MKIHHPQYGTKIIAEAELPEAKENGWREVEGQAPASLLPEGAALVPADIPTPTIAEFLASCEVEDLTKIGVHHKQAEAVITKARTFLESGAADADPAADET